LSVLDIGCVGPAPLAMWRWVYAERGDRFRLTGVDVAGIERAEHVARDRGWKNARFVRASGYATSRALGGERFDVVVSTQVLEHVRNVDRFVGELARVTAPGGRVFLTLDSGHFDRRKSRLREAAKWVAVRLGRERYHEKPLKENDVEPTFERHGLRVVERGYYNLHPLKRIHNHLVGAATRDALAAKWYEVERLLNQDTPFIGGNKQYFLELYYELEAAR
jgi:SAM-dependent methyltransferase